MLDRLCWSDHFESFLANKYSTAKRFGLEGCEVWKADDPTTFTYM
jgi:2-oxoglutarate dehydrogenase E1 component